MNNKLLVPLVVAGVAAASVIVAVARRRPGLVAGKLRIGAMLVALTAGVGMTGCPAVSFYEPPLQPYGSIAAAAGGKLSAAAGKMVDVIIGGVPILTASYEISQSGSILASGALVQVDDSAVYNFAIPSGLAAGEYLLRVSAKYTSGFGTDASRTLVSLTLTVTG